MAIPLIRKPKTRNHRWWRRLRLDVRVFVSLFPWQIAGIFIAVLFLITFVFQQAYLKTFQVDADAFSYIKALYAIINMATFQISFADIPPGPSLDIFFLLVPVISIPLLLMFGVNLIQIVRVFFVRQERGQIWQQALAKTTPNPIVICGLGRVGYRIASQLLTNGYPIVGIEAISTPLVDALIDADMPVILGDIRNIDVLRSASVPRAKQVIICTHDDLTNIMAANHIREMNPNSDLILRLFDDNIAEEIKNTFQIKNIISRSAVAAQAFAYTALGLEVLETFYLEDKIFALAEIPIRNTSQDSNTLAEYTLNMSLTVVCLFHNGEFIIEPPPETELQDDDTLIVFTELAYLADLQNQHDTTQSHIIVCGIGHTGYRIVNALTSLGQNVCAIDFEPNDLTERLKEQGVQVVYGDFRKNQPLLAAKILQASALITCAEDDMVNVETVIRANELAPSTRIIARIFEETLSDRLQKTFHIEAVYSTSEIAAPEFVAATVNLHLTQPVNLANDRFLIARLMIHAQSRVNNMVIHKINQLADTTVLLHCRENTIQIPPLEDSVLGPGDEIIVLTSRPELNQLSI